MKHLNSAVTEFLKMEDSPSTPDIHDQKKIQSSSPIAGLELQGKVPHLDLLDRKTRFKTVNKDEGLGEEKVL